MTPLWKYAVEVIQPAGLYKLIGVCVCVVCSEDIEIIFKRGSWEAKAEFAQTDVHRQIAIVFKTPSYQEQDVGEEVEVKVFLRRLSDHMDSDPVTFTYQPNNTG